MINSFWVTSVWKAQMEGGGEKDVQWKVGNSRENYLKHLTSMKEYKDILNVQWRLCERCWRKLPPDLPLMPLQNNNEVILYRMPISWILQPYVLGTDWFLWAKMPNVSVWMIICCLGDKRLWTALCITCWCRQWPVFQSFTPCYQDKKKCSSALFNSPQSLWVAFYSLKIRNNS